MITVIEDVILYTRGGWSKETSSGYLCHLYCDSCDGNYCQARLNLDYTWIHYEGAFTAPQPDKKKNYTLQKGTGKLLDFFIFCGMHWNSPEARDNRAMSQQGHIKWG